MVSNRIGFKQFIGKLKHNQKLNVIVDSNLLIAFFDEINSNHDEVFDFFEALGDKAEVSFFTTITTKSEFLDYQRRRFLTEGLLELVHT